MDAVAFDFDGVIVRNARMAKVVGGASERFVSRHMNCAMKDAAVINRALYTKHGHTALGVAHELGKDSREIVEDFNRFVYGRMNWAVVDACVQYDDKMRLRSLAELVWSRNVVSGLFTNAPLEWCDRVCAIIGTDMDRIIDPGYYVTSDNLCLKPDDRNYTEVDKMFSDVTQKGGSIYFLDDSHINLAPVYRRASGMNWRSTLVRDDSLRSIVRGLPPPVPGER